jgi:hypothetical protein
MIKKNMFASKAAFISLMSSVLQIAIVWGAVMSFRISRDALTSVWLICALVAVIGPIFGFIGEANRKLAVLAMVVAFIVTLVCAVPMLIV